MIEQVQEGEYLVTYKDGVEIERVINIPVPPVTPTDFGKVVTVLAFRKRFTPSERITIDLASLHDSSIAVNAPANIQAASLRQSQKDLDSAKYVQLDREDIMTDLETMATAGLLAAGRPAEIVGPPVGSVELPASIRLQYGLSEVPSEAELSLNDGRGWLSPSEVA